MMHKRKERKPNPILDDKTAELLFRRDDSMDLGSLKSMITGTVSLEDLVQYPLSDINAINEMLTTIRELVVNHDTRKRMQAVAEAFSIKYDEFYQKVQEYVEAQRADSYSQQRIVRELSGFIGNIAEAAGNLPLDVGSVQFKSKILDEVASNFNRMMEERQDSAKAFFEYIIKLNERIQEKASQGKDKKKVQPAWLAHDDDGMSYQQLKELVDVKELMKFKQYVPTVTAIAAAISPYLRHAEEAIKGKYCEPIIVPKEENCLIIRNGRTPNWRGYVPNNTHLDSDQRVEVLEGVNNGGKTIDMKKAMCIAIAALSGSWVPADYVKVSLRDHIVLRQKGKGDVISAMQQDCRNVKEATPPDGEYWLIGLDETFTSTERRGGRALLYGLITYVAEQGHSLLITSSHYLGMDKFFSVDGRVVFKHFPFERKQGKNGEIEITFPYKKQDGSLSDVKYALAVAASKGFDKKTIEYAQERLVSPQK